MELPFEKTVCRYWKQKIYTLKDQEETQEVRLPESMPDMGRIISSWGQVILRGKEWRTGSIGINGGVMVWVLYAPEGGGPLQRMESWIPFQSRVEIPDGGEDGTIRLECVLRSVDARNTSSRKMMLRVGIGLLVQAMIPQTAQISVPSKLPDDVERLSRTYPLVLTRETGEKTFLVDEDLELPSGLTPVDQLIYFRMMPEVLEQKVMGSKAVFRGMGNLHILYMDPDQRLCCHDFEVPFAQYMDLEGEYEQDAEVSNLFCVTSLELDLQPEGSLRLKCGMVSQYMICAPTVVEILEDAYSPCRDVNPELEGLEMPAWLEDRQEKMDFQEFVPMEDQTMVDQVFFSDLPRVSRLPDGVSVDCGGSFQALLMDREGNYQAKLAKVTGQNNYRGDCDTICFSIPRGRTTCRKEGMNWRMDTQVMLNLKSLCTKPMQMVSGITLGDVREPDPERPSVIIRAKGEAQSLWELAKNSGSTVGAIRKMNGLEGEPEEQRLLLIPVI